MVGIKALQPCIFLLIKVICNVKRKNTEGMSPLNQKQVDFFHHHPHDHPHSDFQGA